MPCVSETDSDVIEDLQIELNRVTALLCEACAAMDQTGLFVKASPELVRWYRGHQAADARRKSHEQKREDEAKAKRKAEFDRLKEEFGNGS